MMRIGAGLLLLVVAASAQDTNARLKALRFVGALGDRELAPVAARALEAMGEDAVPALALALSNMGSPVRGEVAMLLAKIGKDSKEARDALKRAADDRDDWLRVVASGALLDLGEKPEPLVPGLAGALASPHQDVRAAAAKVLARAGQDARNAMPVLMRALEDQDPRVREGARAALAAMGVTAVEPLVDKDRSEILRAAAVQTMGRLGGGAVDRLTKLVQDADEDPAIRREAARSLGSIGKPAASATPALLALAQGSEPNLRSASLLALEAIGGAGWKETLRLRALLKDKEMRLRAWAARGLGGKGSDARKATDDLIVGLNDASSLVRSACAGALARVAADGDALLLLTAGLKGRFLLSRAAAARALGLLGKRAQAAVPELERAARSKNEALAQAARSALSLIQ